MVADFVLQDFVGYDKIFRGAFEDLILGRGSLAFKMIEAESKAVGRTALKC